MSEIFVITTNNSSVSAAQDILAAYAASTKKLKLLSVQLAANGQTTVGNYPIRIIEWASSVTPGTGGVSITPKNLNPSGASPSFTARAVDTTHATATNSNWVISDQFNPIIGYYWQAPRSEAEPKANLSDAIVLSLDSAPGGTINVSATMVLEEI